jgi:hypothetical protein
MQSNPNSKNQSINHQTNKKENKRKSSNKVKMHHRHCVRKGILLLAVVAA